MISARTNCIFVHPERTGGTTVQSWLGGNPEGEREKLQRKDHHATFGEYLSVFPEAFDSLDGVNPTQFLITIRNPYLRAISAHHYYGVHGGVVFDSVGAMVASGTLKSQVDYFTGLKPDHLKRLTFLRNESLLPDFGEWAELYSVEPRGSSEARIHQLAESRDPTELTREDCKAIRSRFYNDFNLLGYSLDPATLTTAQRAPFKS